MNRHELREWLGLAPADLPIYFATLNLVALYFVQSMVGDLLLSALALCLSLIACVFGTRTDHRLSAFTNAAKLMGYPLFLLLVLLVIYLNFTGWAGRHPS